MSVWLWSSHVPTVWLVFSNYCCKVWLTAYRRSRTCQMFNIFCCHIDTDYSHELCDMIFRLQQTHFHLCMFLVSRHGIVYVCGIWLCKNWLNVNLSGIFWSSWAARKTVSMKQLLMMSSDKWDVNATWLLINIGDMKVTEMDDFTFWISLKTRSSPVIFFITTQQITHSRLWTLDFLILLRPQFGLNISLSLKLIWTNWF